jgi:hypothetical protein
MKIADICVFACTGHVGTMVAKRLVELATSPITILLAGRNVAKVRELYNDLVNEATTKSVNLIAYPVSVAVEDEASLKTLVSGVRVVANCIDVQCHPLALTGVAEACIQAGVHYLDLAPQQHMLQRLFDLKTPAPCKSRIVPACGFDYAFMDVASLQAERCFNEANNGSQPEHIQITLALRPGPLGLKWPLRLVKTLFKSSPPARKSSAAANKHSSEQTSSSTNRKFLAFIPLISSWSIQWPMGASSLSLLLSQRHWMPEAVDARMALPRSLWKATALVVYGIVVAAILLPWLYLAWILKVEVITQLIMGVLPYASLGFLSDNEHLCRKSMEELSIELVITLRNVQGLSISYHVIGTSPKILNALCMALASLEMTKQSFDAGGILTPAIALGDTKFWDHLQKWGLLKVQIID